jgi:thiol-disulfide isomerase/thioredoxin
MGAALAILCRVESEDRVNKKGCPEMLPTILLSACLVASNSPLDADLRALEAAAERVRLDPASEQAFDSYAELLVRASDRALHDDPDRAEVIVRHLEELVRDLRRPPTVDDLAERLKWADKVVSSSRNRIRLARIDLDTIKDRVRREPENHESWNDLDLKYSLEVSRFFEDDLDQAAAILKDHHAFFDEIEETIEPARIAEPNRLALSRGNLEAKKKSLARRQRKIAVVGKPAAPLGDLAWAFGEPLDDDALSGKVVLLDFWAPWCVPCLKAMPDLEQLHRAYGDRGLVVIGLTNYHGMDWDEESAGPVIRNEEVPHDRERAMIARLAESMGLSYPLAVEEGEDRELSDFYGVDAIPQIVLIDREGVVRRVSIGEGESELAALRAAIETLIGP